MIIKIPQEQSQLHLPSHPPCEICYLPNPPPQKDNQTPHGICYECWLKHIRQTITRVTYQVGSNIMSPFDGKQSIQVGVAMSGLKGEHKREIEEWLFKKYTAFTTDVQKCPSETCDYAFTMDKCNWRWKNNLQEKCPKCDMPLTQNTEYSIKSFLGFIYFMFLANKCPKCQIPIEKSIGCYHMTCPCGHQFCWFCLKDYSYSSSNLYSVHEPQQCMFIFATKVLLFLTCIATIVLSTFGNQFFQKMMSCFFIGAKYIMHALIIDAILITNFFILSQYIKMPYSRPQLWKTIRVVILADIIFIGILVFMEIVVSTLIVVFFQGLFAAVVIGGIYFTIFSIQTWFEFIM